MPVTAEEVRERNVMTARDAMDKRGMSIDDFLRVVQDGINAKVTRTHKIKGKIASYRNGRKKLAKGVRIMAEGYKPEISKQGTAYDDGDTLVQFDEIDHKIRLEAADMGFRLLGSFAPTKHEHTLPEGTELEKAAIDALKDMAAKHREAGND
jgi:hypothetical protein